MSKKAFDQTKKDRHDGPPLLAFWGDDRSESTFRLGTREVAKHSHLRGQIFCIDSGLIHVRTHHGSWLSPPHRATWIPPGEIHQATINGALSGWSIYIAPRACKILPKQPCVFGVSELMRALVKRAVIWSMEEDVEELSLEQRRIVAVLLDEIRRAPHEALHLAMPKDRRVLKICHALIAQIDRPTNLEQWAQWGGLSPRTLSRVFLAETGLSFGKWRQQAQLTYALEHLAQGESVASVAHTLGYATPSNFIAMFRRNFGDSPAQYFNKRKES